MRRGGVLEGEGGREQGKEERGGKGELPPPATKGDRRPWSLGMSEKSCNFEALQRESRPTRASRSGASEAHNAL